MLLALWGVQELLGLMVELAPRVQVVFQVTLAIQESLDQVVSLVLQVPEEPQEARGQREPLVCKVRLVPLGH